MAQFRVQQWATFARTWWLYDAKWQSPFVSAYTIIKYLEGRHKPIYHPTSDLGDHVVVINTREIAMRDELWRTFKYHHHTGYAGGYSETRAYKLHQKEPTKVLEKAVYATIKGNLLRRGKMARLHLYPDNIVPEDIMQNVSAQIQQVQAAPRRLDQYTEEERESFPRLYDWPEDYVVEHGNKKPKS